MRIWALGCFAVLDANPEAAKRSIEDSFHHYQLGFLFFALAYPLRKQVDPRILLGIGTGIVLEEFPVLLAGFGLPTLAYYNTGFDLAVVLAGLWLAYFSGQLRKKQRASGVDLR